MKGNWPDETVRLLENWAMWVAGGRISTWSRFPAYNLALPGPRAGNVIPILGVEAEKADRIITDMVPRYQKPLRMHYLWLLRSDRSRALACNCALDTYKARLDEAHALFMRTWHAQITLLRPVVFERSLERVPTQGPERPRCACLTLF